MMDRRSIVLLGWFLLLVLASCSATDSPPEDTVEVAQDVDVAVDTAADAAEPQSLLWSECHESFQCATLQVPLDYADPDGKTIDLALMRSQARDRANRIGVLLFDHVAPAGALIPYILANWSKTELYWPELHDRFDIVAYNSRVFAGASSVQCPPFNAEAYRSVAMVPSDESGWAAWGDFFGSYFEGCVQQTDPDLLRNMGLEAKARDVESIRLALGEETISYMAGGFSPGAVYLTRYPNRVRAMVLEDPVWLTDLPDFARARAQAHEEALNTFFDMCSQDPSCAFHGGEDAGAIAHAYDALFQSLGATLLPTADGRKLGPVDFGNGVRCALIHLGGYEALCEGLYEAQQGDGTDLMLMADQILPKQSLLGSMVFCSDLPVPEGIAPQQFAQTVTDMEGEFPRLTRFAAYDAAACMYWPLRSPKGVAISAASAPPILVVAGQHNPMAPFGDAQALLQALDNGSYLLTHDGRGAYSYSQSRCLTDAFQAYVLDPTEPPVTNCTVD